tara:strand:+ start:1710 stop:1919 length:210 start_codon:yes stop_codon:yes gene_type:complete
MPQGPGTYDKPGRPKKKVKPGVKMKKAIRKLKKRKKKKKRGRGYVTYKETYQSNPRPISDGGEDPIGGN